MLNRARRPMLSKRNGPVHRGLQLLKTEGDGRITPHGAPTLPCVSSIHEEQKLFRIREHRASIERNIMLGTIVLVLLILMLIGALPTWPHSRSWGYYPSGGLGLVLVVLLVLFVLGRV